MKEFFSSLKFKILIFVAALLAGFVIYAISNNDMATIMEQGLDFIVTPVKSLSTSISNGISEFFGRYTNSSALYDENEKLKEEINELKRKQANYNSMKLQNDSLRAFLKIQEINPTFELEPALVIGMDTNEKFAAFTINRGYMHGIKANDPVITDEGLVGVVTQVNAISSRVITILDMSVKVGSYVSSTNEVGMIKNDVKMASQGLCELTMLPRATQAQAGDLVLTSGSSDLFPSGIIVGEITEIKLGESGLSTTAAVKPAVDLENVKNVAVIKSFTSVPITPEGSSSEGVSSEEQP